MQTTAITVISITITCDTEAYAVQSAYAQSKFIN